MNKTLSEIKQDPNGFQFTCWYDATINMPEEILDAKRKCNAFDILCIYAQKDTAAVVRSLGAHDEQNKSSIEGIRTYLLKNGWVPAEKK